MIPNFLRDTRSLVGQTFWCKTSLRCGMDCSEILDPPKYDLNSGKWHCLANVHGALCIVALNLKFPDEVKA